MCLLIWRGRLSALLINGRCEKDKNMKQFLSFVIKESKHILRDRRTMLILFGMPVMLMLLFGFAITTDVRNVRTVVVTSQMDHLTQQTVERLAQSEYFTITKAVATPKEAERLIRNQKADMAVVFGQDFASKKSGLQFIVDGSDPNMAQQWTNYAQQVIANSQYSLVNTKMLYNPQMRSAYNFVPAIMGMLLMLICAMMTSISIVREKEKGTMEVLLVTAVGECQCAQLVQCVVVLRHRHLPNVIASGEGGTSVVRTQRLLIVFNSIYVTCFYSLVNLS
jgi:ABC-2 type transport system permease protein